MKLWIGILIGIVIGFVIGIIIMPIEYDYDLDCDYDCDESADKCEEIINDYIVDIKECRENHEEFADWCFNITNNWKELFDDLMKDNGYEYNYDSVDGLGYDDYEPENFMVIGGIEYDCTYNRYDCKDFPEWADAQTLFTYCKTEGKGDIHYLDGDNDGNACEELNWDYGESTLNFGLL